MAEEEKNPQAEEILKTTKKFLLKERYEIQFDTPLSQHNTNGAEAYRVVDKISPKRELFALICSSETAPRISMLATLKAIDNPNILKLVEYGTVIAYPSSIRTLALIYQTPEGPRITDAGNVPDLRQNPEKYKTILHSISSALGVFKSQSMTHRAIRLDNLYFRDSSMSEIVLGDCLASFPAFFQPPVYETVESLLATPEGRGKGDTGNDIYSAAVAALFLLNQKNAPTGLTTPEAIRFKLRKTSYMWLTQDYKVPNIYSNMFKGLLNDDTESRWDLAQLYNFLEGKPGNFSISGNAERPKKSININQEKCYTPQAIAFAMQNAIPEGLEIIKSGKLLEWIRSGLENERLYTRLEKVIKQELSSATPEIMVSKVCIVLNPEAPIKLDDMAVYPDGISKAIFYNIKKQNNLNPFYNILSNDLVKLWYAEQPASHVPAIASELKNYINRKDYGYGIERIMYDLDPYLPCISPLVGNELVISAPQLLKALDKNYERNKKNTIPFDRTVIAYLRCKLGKKFDHILTEINSAKPNNQITSALKMYSDIQRKYGPAQLPNLAKWLINYSSPIIKLYHNKKYQKSLEKDIVRFAREGKIIDIYASLENEGAKAVDAKNYTLALKELSQLLTQKHNIQSGNSRIDDTAQNSALKLAAIVSILVMTLSLVITFINWMLS